jgi:hypothetical protein
MCQKNYGGLFQTTVKFPLSAFSYSHGQPKFYASSEFGRRGFCANCGSPIVFMYEGASMVWVLLGSLDHPEDWPLTAEASWGEIMHVAIETKMPWLALNDGLRQKSSEQIIARAAAQQHVARGRRGGGDGSG